MYRLPSFRSVLTFRFFFDFCFCFCCFLFSCSLSAQEFCGGNLGENIFEEGDFGRGSANVLATDPGIAPGFNYTTSVPPFDGFYTITNNTASWPGLFSTWLGVRDNSTDPVGYMMVVNASFSPGLFYTQQIDGLCENTLYQFTADILNIVSVGTPDHIDPDVSFLLDDAVAFTTGNIPKTNEWNTYGFTFTTDPGQTSLTLSLRNNAPGGIGNDLALDNISFRACGPEAQILPETIKRICEDGQFTDLEATIIGDQYVTPAVQWQRSLDAGENWEDIPGETDLTFTHTELSSGFYYYRYLLANGTSNLQNTKCRVVSNVKIVEVVPKFWEVTDTICDGLRYFTGSNAYDISGVYVDTLLSSLGCDSIVTLDLTVIPDPGLIADFSIEEPPCPGDLGSITVAGPGNGAPPFTYQFETMAAGDNNFFPDLSPGRYAIGIMDRHGCRVQDVADIPEPVVFTVELGEDQQVTLGDPAVINLEATDNIANLLWNPAADDCVGDCRRIELLPVNSATYSVTATSERGCLAVDSLRLSVIKERRVYFPNAFTPNFDGVNDHFAPFVQVPNVQRIPVLRVFNRWGALVFEGADLNLNDPSSGWDGKWSGQEAENGIYVYQTEIEFLDGVKMEFSGDVLLIR